MQIIILHWLPTFTPTHSIPCVVIRVISKGIWVLFLSVLPSPTTCYCLKVFTNSSLWPSMALPGLASTIFSKLPLLGFLPSSHGILKFPLPQMPFLELFQWLMLVYPLVLLFTSCTNSSIMIIYKVALF